jgi:uncharacterized protein
VSTSSVATTADVYAPPVQRTLEPVAPSERIRALDLLRGWAMFGVLWSNLNDWYGTADETTWFDRALGMAQGYVIESRFYTLLCFLFGIGFGIQLLRAEERGTSVRRTYVRRSLALLVIGLVHALLIWHGDILTMYALASFALLLFRNETPKRQLVWAFAIYFLGIEVVTRLLWISGLRFAVPPIPQVTGSWIYGHGTLAQISHQRVADVADWYGRWGLITYLSVVGMFLAGVWAFRSGFFRRVVSDRRATRRLLAWCMSIAALQFVLAMLASTLVSGGARTPGSTLAVMLQWRRLVFRTLDPTMAMGLAYAALLLLAFQTRRGQRLLAPLVATGRMALTTYLAQSVVCTLLFYSYGLGWFGRVGYTGMFAITLVLFGLQMAANTWWLRRYRFGPVEWLWRTLTYGRVPAMRVG